MKCFPFRLIPVFLATALPLSAAQFKFGNQTLTVPDGFTVEQVAGPDLAPRPIEADFDEQGRLYVTDSSGSNEKAEKQLEQKSHRVVRLEDTDGDGKFDKSTVFADKLTFPEGCMWLDGSLYVSGVPTIWKLTDTTGGGIADKREEWHQGKTMTGCDNDLHGPYLGPDGWIYWCKGAFAEQTYEQPGKKPLVSKAAHIFRKRPEGGVVEPVLTGGMDNPVGVTFTEDGERILSGTFFVNPEAGHRDGLIHAIYGGVYGKPHPEVLDGHKRTGELMPLLTHLGPAAACGLTRYQSSEFGHDFHGNLFVCCFNLKKVVRVMLENDGATYKSREQDFIVSDSTDFHPTDVLEDADGSLIVVDTGGWYKICCPTSQLWKPDVFGGIFRIRRAGAHQMADPRGLKMNWAADNGELVKRLDDLRPAVVERAIQQLAKNGKEAIAPLSKVLASSASVKARLNALWALTRMNLPEARWNGRIGLADVAESVRHAAIQSASVWRDAGAQELLQNLIRTGSAQIKRVAAEALGRLGDKAAVPSLLAAAPAQPDRVLEHSLTYAMIEIDDPASTTAGLTDANPFAQRCALIALDQMDHGGLKPEQVTPLLLSSNSALKETGAWLVSHHPEWGEALAGFLRDELTKTNSSKEGQSALENQLAQLASGATVQQLLADTVAGGKKSAQLTALHAMAQSHVKAAPVSWANALAKAAGDSDASVVREAVGAARYISFAERPTGLSSALLTVAHDTSLSAEERCNALAAARGQIPLDAPLFEFLRAHLDSAQPVSVRGTAAAVLERSKASPEQLHDLTENLKVVGPMELGHLLGAYEHSTNETLGLTVVAALKEAKAHSSLRAEAVKPKLAKFPAAVQQKLDEFLATLNVDSAKQKAHIEELVANYKDGNVYRGQAVFNSPKVGCVTCHAIGYVGGKVGPDLTSIGKIRTERDLFEAIVYPSASFVRSYEPMVVTTKDGEDYSGVVKKDAPDEVVLATGAVTEQRIPRGQIADMHPGSVSIMPQGLEEQMSRQELSDLVVFLKSSLGGTH